MESAGVRWLKAWHWSRPLNLEANGLRFVA